MSNRIVIAAAGSGKTTTVVRRACDSPESAAALITYTLNGRDALQQKTYETYKHIPPHVEIYTWYSFLLRHMIRPFQSCIEEERVSGLNFVTSQSTRFVSEVKTRKYYFTKDLRIHSDKASKFACKVIERSDAAPVLRLERIYDCVFIDECQDLAGYDLDLIEYLLRSDIELQLVGDYRQTTFLTHPPRRNRKYIGPKQLDKFKEWEASGLCTIEHQDYSYRCVQQICDLADKFHPNAPDTVSRNKTSTEHDGVFAVRRCDLQNYYEKYSPQPLRYDKRTKCQFGSPLNYGASKGMTFERTLIYPHRKLHAYLCSGDLADAGNALEKIYVAITRARQSVAFVIDDAAEVTGMSIFDA